MHLLTAVMKCFLRRPPETQKALGAALAAGLADFHQVWVDNWVILNGSSLSMFDVSNIEQINYCLLQDVHDRALFYYRLLQYNVSVAENVVNPPKQAVSVFADTQSSEIKDRIFDEFNSLSVVYQKVSFSKQLYISNCSTYRKRSLGCMFPFHVFVLRIANSLHPGLNT